MAWIPSGSKTLKQLRDEIAQYREMAQQDRIERGLPAERPGSFVDETLSYVLYYDKLADFYPIAVKYAKILTSGIYIELDTDSLAEYRKYAELLRFSKAFNVKQVAHGIITLLSLADKINGAIVAGTTDSIDHKRTATTLSLCLTLIHVDDGLFRYDHESEEATTVREARMKEAEVALRNDPERYAAELEQAFKRYDEIKEMIQHE